MTTRPSRFKSAKTSRRRFLQAGLGAFGLGCAGAFYTWRFEPHWLEMVQRPLPVPGLPNDVNGWRLAQISDLHIGSHVDDEYLKRSFEQIHQLRPEIVVYTGDFISYHSDILDHAKQMFRHLPLGTKGTFGILGNHDYGPGWAQAPVANGIAELATEAGITVLRNEIALLNGIHLVGLDDLWSKQFNLNSGLHSLPKGASAIALSHNPDTADSPGWDTFAGWILSGHTHGGQCKPPFLPPPLLPVRNRRYTAGAFQLSAKRHLYINRGLGYLVRLRFSVRPEITLFRLHGQMA